MRKRKGRGGLATRADVARFTINAPRSAEVMENREAYAKACEEAIRTAKERVKKERKN